MNCQKINQIPINQFLFSLNIGPVKISGGTLRYFSPLRKESTPSFDVSLTKNVWIDRGTGEGGYFS